MRFLRFLILAAWLGLAAAGHGNAADIDTLLNQAFEAYNVQDYPRVLELAGAVLQADPDHGYANYLAGVIYSHNRDFAKAVSHLEKSMTSGAPPEGTEELLNSAYIFAGRSDLALPYYEKLQTANPGDEYAAMQHAMALQYTGQDDEALALYQKLALSGGNYADAARYQMAEIYMHRRDYAEAKRLYDGIDATSAYASAALQMSSQLAKSLRFLRAYATLKYVYDDNPLSVADHIPGDPPDSEGMVFSLLLNSRDFYLAKNLMGRFQLYYSGTYYTASQLADNEFESFSLTPVYLTYSLTNQTSLEMIGVVQFERFDSQEYSTSYSLSLGVVHGYGKGNSIVFNLTAADRNFTDDFTFAGVATSFEFNDGQEYGLTCDWLPLSSQYMPVSLGLHYRFGFFDADNVNDAEVGEVAKQQEYLEHSVSMDVYHPFKGALSRISVLGNASYSYREYSTDRVVYLEDNELAPEKRTASIGAAMQVLIWEKQNLLLELGAQYTNVDSNARVFEYSSTSYYAKLAAKF